MPVQSPYAEKLAAMPVSTGDVSVLGSTTRYWAYGPADASTTIIAVHGYRGEHHGLEPVIAQLSSTRVIAPDLPGFGESAAMPHTPHDIDGYADWLMAFVRALQLEETSIVLGHSFGSIVASAALSKGLRPRALILINPIAISGLKGSRPISTAATVGFYRVAGKLPERAARSVLASPIIVQFMSSALAKTKDRSLRRWIHDQHHTYFSRFANRQSLLEGFEASIHRYVGEFSASIEVPTLLIAAELDDITPLEANRQLARDIPGAALEILPGVGHLIHYESPEPAAAAVERFIGTLGTP